MEFLFFRLAKSHRGGNPLRPSQRLRAMARGEIGMKRRLEIPRLGDVTVVVSVLAALARRLE